MSLESQRKKYIYIHEWTHAVCRTFTFIFTELAFLLVNDEASEAENFLTYTQLTTVCLYLVQIEGEPDHLFQQQL